MTLWVNLGVVYLCSFFARYSATNINTGPVFVKPNKILVLLAVVSLVLISGLRKGMADTYFYMLSYSKTDFTWEYVLSSKDMGFNIFQMFLQKISKDPQILVFTCSLITNVLIVLVLYKYSRLFELSIYVYLTGGMYLTSMNGMRQFFAAAILFAATKYIFDGSWKKFSLVVLIASFLHQSALIFIPIYFLVRRKTWNWTTVVMLLGAIVIVIGFNQFSSVLFSLLGDSQYGHYKDYNAGGANIMRVGVSSAPLILAFLGREKLSRIFPNSDYIVNMSLLGLVFMTISTQNWIFARFSIYFELYNLILISWIVILFKNSNRKFIYYAILICYFLFCYYEQVIIFGTIYQSDYIN